MAVGWRSLQEASNQREVGSTSGECLGGVNQEQVMVKPVLRVMRERSRSRDDRDRDRLPQGERLGSMDSQATTENAGGEASGSAGDVAVPAGATAEGSTGMTSDGRTRRNEEMADLTSQANVELYGRDAGVIAATPPDEVSSHADRRRQSEERLGRDLRNRVRIETEEGEEELSIMSGNDVEQRVMKTRGL